MNDWNRLYAAAKQYQEMYPPGTRIILQSMGDDIHRVPDNTRGTVLMVDSIGTIHCLFDNGKSLGMIPGEDSFRKLTEAELAEETSGPSHDGPTMQL